MSRQRRPIKQCGWMFDVLPARDEYFLSKAYDNILFANFYEPIESCVIKHVESGITFRFHCLDLFIKAHSPKSDIRCYYSPLETEGIDVFAYNGRVSIEKVGEKTQGFVPVWEDIDQFETLIEQIAWTTEESRISCRQARFEYFQDRAVKSERKEREPARNKSMSKDSVYLLINCSYLVFTGRDEFNCENDCYFHLHVTDSGWIFHLYQFFEDPIRTREMTMHCKFEQNIVYHEITETQYASIMEAYAERKSRKDNEMCVLFHETKQFKIRGPIFYAQRDRMSISSNLRKAYAGGVDIPEKRIGFLLANCSQKIKSIETTTGTRIQIIPLFHDPYKQNRMGALVERLTRRAYIDGQENDIKRAKSHFHELIEAESKKKIGIVDEVLSGVDNLFLE